MNITKKVMNPLRVMINVVPSAPTTRHEHIEVVNDSDIFGKIDPGIVSEVEVFLVVPGVKLTRILVFCHALVVVDEVNALVLLE